MQKAGKDLTLSLPCSSPSFLSSGLLHWLGEVLGKWARNHIWGLVLKLCGEVTPEEPSDCKVQALPSVSYCVLLAGRVYVLLVYLLCVRVCICLFTHTP